MFKNIHLAIKFSLYTAVFLILLAIGLNFITSTLLKEEMVEITRSSVAGLIQTHAIKELLPHDFSVQEPASVKEKFKKFFGELKSPDIVRIKVWDRSGRVIFSDDESIVGQSFPDNEEFREAVSGNVVVEIQKPLKPENRTEAAYSQLMEVYVPVVMAEGSRNEEVAGVIEAYFTLDSINSLIAKSRLNIGIFSGLAFIAFWFVMFFLFKKIVQKPLDEMEKFKLAVENASDHIIITDSNGVILYANKSAEKITGYLQEELIGARPSLWGKKMPKEFYEKMWKTIKYDKKEFKEVLENRRKTGERYFAEVTIIPILGSNSEVVFFVGVERDTTKEKELEYAQKELISVASHQLRTPLSALGWLNEMLQRSLVNVKLNEKQSRYLNDMTTSLQRATKLTEDLLNVSRIQLETVQVSTIRLGASKFVIDVIDEMQTYADSKEHKIIFDGNRITDAEVEADPKILKTILQNLISNAIDYSPPKTSVWIILEKTGRFLKISVSNEGPSIPKEDQPKLFSKFYRSEQAKKMKTEGTGLGLFIVKSFVEELGGKVGFESEEGRETVFWFTIPLV